MLSAYPETSTSCSDEYLATLAQVLCGYPREIAIQACSPVHGVPKQHKDFKPTAGQVRQWCEDESERLYERLKLETKRLPAPTVPQTTEAERIAHVERLRKTGQLLGQGPEADLRLPWWQRLDPKTTLERYEREAQQELAHDDQTQQG